VTRSTVSKKPKAKDTKPEVALSIREQVLADPRTPFEIMVDDIISYRGDPFGFVKYIFPWGEGELEKFKGPDKWQEKILCDIRDGLLTVNEAIQIAVASGHGIGKSALVAWIIYWAMSTMEDTKGIVTANTETQLKTKTWAELAKWHRLAANSSWFEFTATALFSTAPDHDKTWRVDMVAWSETRSEAFAGLHNKGKRVLLIFDEASAIPDSIWEVAEGALTDEDTEIIWCCFGNPTRSRGRFRECFGRFKQRWRTYQIDSRTAAMTNKKQLQAWVDDYGEESDFVKVRVRGMFPSADANALLSAEEVDAAMNRAYTERESTTAPKLLGVDVARQGGDDSVIAKRQGRSVFPLRTMHLPDSMLVAAAVAAEQESWNGADATFIDATGGYGVGVVDKLRELGRTCTEVYFSGKATDPRYFNKRSEMIFEMSKWIKSGGSLPKDPFLREELCAYTYEFSGDKFRVCDKDIIKDEIGRSPDRSDAIALTFAFPALKRLDASPFAGRGVASARKDYNPLERD
jgi:hypothetical protein